MMVNFILFSLMTAGIALIVERQNGTLQRLMTTRLRRWELIGGKAAGMFLLTFVQQILLIGVAQIFFGVDYLRDPAALLLMMVSLSLVASTLGLLLASRPQERAGAHRDHRARLDGSRRALRRLVPARDHRTGVPDRRAPAAMKRPLSSGKRCSTSATALSCSAAISRRVVIGRPSLACASHCCARAIGMVSSR